jgi:epoxyqueuosine reductase
MAMHSISAKLRLFSQSIGIDLMGFAPASFDAEGEKHLQEFVAEGRNADMDYLENVSKRVRPSELLPGAKTVIVIALNYYREQPPLPPGHGRIARYAYGRDYHKVVKNKLKALDKYILELAPEATNYLAVDANPILEKSYAVRAGLGFTGKNTTLITPEYGSFVVLGELLTTLELPPTGALGGTCGTCTRCLDSCPTQALIAPGKMDARRCISYLTIEKRDAIDPSLSSKIGTRIFGCDICQEVCPYNKANAKPNTQPDFQNPIAGDNINLHDLISMPSEEAFKTRFAGSPLMRAKLRNLKRNAEIASSR